MKGLWVFVCGPSGAGKDSVIAWAAQALAHKPRIAFARRLITRPAGPGSDHDEISPAAFSRRRAADGLAWHWRAHGHDYGIAAGYAQDVADGAVVVVNGSREHAAALQPRPDNVKVVLVTAAGGRVAQRLRARGREDPAAIASRIERNGTLPELAADLVIGNDSELALAGRELAAFLLHV